MRRMLFAGLVLVTTPAHDQPKMLHEPVERFHYTCDEGDGICAIPVEELLFIVQLAQRGAANCR